MWVCSTGKGSLLELTYPEMTVKRELELFTLREHVNTIAVVGQDTLWVVLHNLGQVCLQRGAHTMARNL